MLLSPAIYSYTTWMLQPSSLSASVRSVEWVRAKVPYGNGLVDEIEHVYYGWKAPKKGGPQLKSLPAIGLTQPATGGGGRLRRVAKAPKRAAWPPRIKPVFAHPLPGEGIWKPTGPPAKGGPPVLVTTFRTELDYPRIVADVAWFDNTRTALAFYPGRYEPPNAAVRGPMMVPYDQRWRLLATFNGAFTYTDGWNGSTDNGRMNEPLKDGNATLVGYRDGRVAIVKWSGGPNAGPNVAWARQSLLPIVWNGRLNPALNDSTKWGYTLGNAVRVWRTGVGIDRRGNLHLRRRRRPDGDHHGENPSARGRGAGDAVRHQPRMAYPDHLHPRSRSRPEGGRDPTDAVRHSLPRPRRPRFLRRLPTPARSRHRPVQVGSRRRRPSSCPPSRFQ